MPPSSHSWFLCMWMLCKGYNPMFPILSHSRRVKRGVVAQAVWEKYTFWTLKHVRVEAIMNLKISLIGPLEYIRPGDSSNVSKNTKPHLHPSSYHNKLALRAWLPHVSRTFTPSRETDSKLVDLDRLCHVVIAIQRHTHSQCVKVHICVQGREPLSALSHYKECSS